MHEHTTPIQQSSSKLYFCTKGVPHTHAEQSTARVSLWHCMQAAVRFVNNEFMGSRLVWLQIKPFTLSKSIFCF